MARYSSLLIYWLLMDSGWVQSFIVFSCVLIDELTRLPQTDINLWPHRYPRLNSIGHKTKQKGISNRKWLTRGKGVATRVGGQLEKMEAGRVTRIHYKYVWNHQRIDLMQIIIKLDFKNLITEHFACIVSEKRSQPEVARLTQYFINLFM